MLEKRVEAVEADVKSIKETLQRMEVSFARVEATVAQLPKAADLASLKADIFEVKGKLSSFPTSWMLFGALIATWGAGAAIVFTVVRFAGK